MTGLPRKHELSLTESFGNSGSGKSEFSSIYGSFSA